MMQMPAAPRSVSREDELYEPFDQTSWLGRSPWDDTPALKAWEKAHGHDARLKCYVEFGCQVIEPTLERRIAALEAQVKRYREALDLTRRHFRCPDCDQGVTSTNDRCKTCDGTGLDTDTDFRLATALSEPKETQ